jgi:hypothetical protein
VCVCVCTHITYSNVVALESEFPIRPDATVYATIYVCGC